MLPVSLACVRIPQEVFLGDFIFACVLLLLFFVCYLFVSFCFSIFGCLFLFVFFVCFFLFVFLFVFFISIAINKLTIQCNFKTLHVLHWLCLFFRHQLNHRHNHWQCQSHDQTVIGHFVVIGDVCCVNPFLNIFHEPATRCLVFWRNGL